MLNIFPDVPRVNGRLLLVGDSIKIPKEGRKMPAVKGLHQESESNSKPAFIMGHSFQAVGVLVGALNSIFAIPLISRIHEGVCRFESGQEDIAGQNDSHHRIPGDR